MTDFQSNTKTLKIKSPVLPKIKETELKNGRNITKMLRNM